MSLNHSTFIDILAFYVIITIWLNMRSVGKEVETGKLFRTLIVTSGIMLIMDGVLWQIDGWVFPGCREIIIVLSALLYILQALYCLLWLRYEMLWVFGRTRINSKRWMIPGLIPLFMVCALMIVNFRTHSIFIVEEDCLYYHADGYLFVLTAIFIYIILGMVIAGVGIARAADKEQHKSCLSMMQFMAIQLIGTVSDIFNMDITMTQPFIAFGLLMVYLNVQQRVSAYQKLVIADQKQALTEKQVAIMISQIQPHFLYNALNTIQNLCRKDPQKAITAVGDFADYLRVNLDSINQRGLIRFEKELEHIRTYCDIELMRFGDHVNIEYALDTVDFSLPTLTVQPLVENAVRYGVTKKMTPGKVIISTRETEDAWLIIVSDDGVGFDIEGMRNDGRSHVGIENVRGRLEAQCGGTLDIESSPGKGTTATIVIPKGGIRI